ncbi:MAG TPA: toll/interleukin-1 receptor domain-containing protein [Ktedonobacteraceae bacterium]|nr:toll/interleukin-1 receptor domain-containing protein [Ktedonobacteraceae bacterium]
MSSVRVPVEVFCCYAHSDEKWRAQLEKHLSTLKLNGLISLWHDRCILPGANWSEAIDHHLETASIILLLISADFIASDYCSTVEMKRALERHAAGEARVIPVVVRSCDWQHLPVGKLQALPRDARPINKRASRDDGWTEVATGLRRLIEDFSQSWSNTASRKGQPLVSAGQSALAPFPSDALEIDLLAPLAEKPACAWVIAWKAGEKLTNVQLEYDDQPDASRYTSTLQDDLLRAVDAWSKERPERYHELQEQAECVAIRMVRARRLHYSGRSAVPQSKFCIWLEPARYTYYVGIHTQLGKTEFRALRQKYFRNALIDLESGQPLILPSNFALHVAVVSKDRHLLLRQRNRAVSNYPLAWEAGVGEFMHGPGPINGLVPEGKTEPGYSAFRHFSKKRIPNLYFFLKNAIAEELGYRGAMPGNFRLYGFAVEYQTLAPKLLAVYHSDCTIEELLQSAGGENVRDPARTLSSIALAPHAIVEAFSNTRYASWEPKAKLLILLALKQDLAATGKYEQSLEVAKLTERFKIEVEPVDPWEYPVDGKPGDSEG